MHFAEWVLMRRKALRMSQAECAERAGVSTPVWCEYENTERNAQPRKATVVKIADALGISRSEALEAAGYVVNAPEVPPKLVAAWRKMANASQEKQRAWLDSVDRITDLAVF